MDACSFSENCLKKFQGQVEKQKVKDGRMYTNLMVRRDFKCRFLRFACCALSKTVSHCEIGRLQPNLA